MDKNHASSFLTFSIVPLVSPIGPLERLVHWSAGGILQGFLTSAADVVDGEQTGHVGEVELEADLRRI